MGAPGLWRSRRQLSPGCSCPPCIYWYRTLEPGPICWGWRRRDYSRPRMAVPVEEIQPPVALTAASLASAT